MTAASTSASSRRKSAKMPASFGTFLHGSAKVPPAFLDRWSWPLEPVLPRFETLAAEIGSQRTEHARPAHEEAHATAVQGRELTVDDVAAPVDEQAHDDGYVAAGFEAFVGRQRVFAPFG